ncbi:MAG: hypothetical protein AAF993_18205 [Pseudomonadota bacterium]
MTAGVDELKPDDHRLVQPLLVAPLRSASQVLSADRRHRGERRRYVQSISFVDRRRRERRETALQALLWSSGAGR